MRNYLSYSIFSYIILALIGFSCKENPPTQQEIAVAYDSAEQAFEEDSLIAVYRDSLLKYFSPLEMDLIRQYKYNHENLITEMDFYTFYRNANTLRKTLTKTLNKYAMKRRDANLPLASFDWFENLARGYRVFRFEEQGRYMIFFDYLDLEEHAMQTEGTHDDEFISLLEMSYDSVTHKNNWTAEVGGTYCSQLGTGKHFEILQQANSVLESSRIFYKEIHKIQVALINDILFSQNYCNSMAEVRQEITKIIDEVEFTGKEIELLKIRLEQVSESEDFNLHFNCTTEDCPEAPVMNLRDNV